MKETAQTVEIQTSLFAPFFYTYIYLGEYIIITGYRYKYGLYI